MDQAEAGDAAPMSTLQIATMERTQKEIEETMSMDRRDLLKRFGIGAIIAPIVGGVVERSASAELIEIPKVKPVELFSSVPKPVDLRKVKSAQIVLEMNDGQTRTISLNRWPWGEGKIEVTDRLAARIEFLRVENSSPRSEHRIGRVFGDGMLS